MAQLCITARYVKLTTCWQFTPAPLRLYLAKRTLCFFLFRCLYLPRTRLDDCAPLGALDNAVAPSWVKLDYWTLLMTVTQPPAHDLALSRTGDNGAACGIAYEER